MLTRTDLHPYQLHAIDINRVFAMPNASTFQIQPISEFLYRYVRPGLVVVDPFSGSSKIGTIRNDANHEFFELHGRAEDALEFMGSLPDGCADVVLLDPPYSPRQIAESYAAVGGSWDGKHPKFIAALRDHAARVVRVGGSVLSFGWNSTGCGKTRGFVKTELLLVNHGGSHNDTICLAERRENQG